MPLKNYIALNKPKVVPTRTERKGEKLMVLTRTKAPSSLRTHIYQCEILAR